MFSIILAVFTPKFTETAVYMLQTCEYQAIPYLKWLWSTNDFRKVMYRRTLNKTRKARMLLTFMRAGIILQTLVAVGLIVYASDNDAGELYIIAGSLVMISSVLWANLLVVPILVARYLVVKPQSAILVWKTRNILTNHPGVKIAVAGSYGKTTVKEILLTVLSEGRNVAATPANKNVAISHAKFAQGLKGDEDVIIIEYGEGKPGDVIKFARATKPNIGVITGLAPAHLDRYKTLKATGGDIFSLADYLSDNVVYVNGDSSSLNGFIKKSHIVYDASGLDGWKVGNVKSDIEGLNFTLKKGTTSLNIKSHLVGQHQLGALSLAAVIAHKLGLSKAEIEKGAAKTKPFEHRMKPISVSGGWLIDDSYNGNIEGIKAGLELLKELSAMRKVYITPGLVDQGIDSPAIHKTLGRLIAKANPDVVVLIKHTVTDDILQGIKDGEYKGQVRIEDDPLDFYTNINHFIAKGDLVLMQNDWPDNYN